MFLVCRDCDQHRIVEADAKEKPFDLNSKQPIVITDDQGQQHTVPFSEWVKTLDTNGRGGT